MNKKLILLAGVFALLVALAGVTALYADDSGSSNNGNREKDQGIGDVRLGF